MTLGWCTGRQWLCSPVGIHIRDFTSTALGSHLEWVLGSGYLAALAGVGITGVMIGAMKAGASSITTTRTSPIAELLLIAIALTRAERTSVMPIFMVEVLMDI